MGRVAAPCLSFPIRKDRARSAGERGGGVYLHTPPPRRIGGVCVHLGVHGLLGCKTPPWGVQHLGRHSTLGCVARGGAQQFGVCSNLGCTCCMAGCTAIRGAEQLFGVHSTPRRAAWRGAQPWFGVHSNLGCTTLRSAPTSRSRTPRGCTAFWGAQHLKAQHPVGCTAPWGAQRLGLWGVSGCTTPRGAWHQGGAGPFGVHGASACAAPRGAEPVSEHSTPGCCRPLAPQGATAPTLCLILGCSRAPPCTRHCPPPAGCPKASPMGCCQPSCIHLGAWWGLTQNRPPPPPWMGGGGWGGGHCCVLGCRWGWGLPKLPFIFIFKLVFKGVGFFFFLGVLVQAGGAPCTPSRPQLPSPTPPFPPPSPEHKTTSGLQSTKQRPDAHHPAAVSKLPPRERLFFGVQEGGCAFEIK
ncbi:uncharacterized protein LOC129782909 [Falco peregrinus]|uniref:uncharacterized protein LOC129782909 n=1 Tax=Falco peregrinus TaxID=8954 RepID=UPI00247A993C|nr:uncharacterized protein LOC129782909 [Falco peregrinus]